MPGEAPSDEDLAAAEGEFFGLLLDARAPPPDAAAVARNLDATLAAVDAHCDAVLGAPAAEREPAPPAPSRPSRRLWGPRPAVTVAVALAAALLLVLLARLVFSLAGEPVMAGTDAGGQGAPRVPEPPPSINAVPPPRPHHY